jgi:hypothetical protein
MGPDPLTERSNGPSATVADGPFGGQEAVPVTVAPDLVTW